MTEAIDTHALAQVSATSPDLLAPPEDLHHDPDTATNDGADLLSDDFSSASFAKTPLWLVGDVTGQIIDLWMHGKLEQDKAYQALAALMVTEDDGTQWSFGATTRRWFKRLPGGGWRLTRPPADSSALATPSEKAVEAALRLLGVNPENVAISSDSATAAPSSKRSDSDLLDGILEDYGS